MQQTQQKIRKAKKNQKKKQIRVFTYLLNTCRILSAELKIYNTQIGLSEMDAAIFFKQDT